MNGVVQTAGFVAMSQSILVLEALAVHQNQVHTYARLGAGHQLFPKPHGGCEGRYPGNAWK